MHLCWTDCLIPSDVYSAAAAQKPPEVARKLVKFRFDSTAQARINKLARNCNEGILHRSALIVLLTVLRKSVFPLLWIDQTFLDGLLVYTRHRNSPNRTKPRFFIFSGIHVPWETAFANSARKTSQNGLTAEVGP